MKRNLDFNEISDGKRYKSDDLAKISCNGCKGCSECCKVTDDTIHLDPYDISLLTANLSKNFTELLNEGIINFTVIDGIITPYLNKKKDSSCVFLSADGRCDIHNARPGFCRLFPLGRIYNEDSSFDYFIQIHECPYPNKSKIKIKQWLGIDNLKEYENYILEYHTLLKRLEAELAICDESKAKALNMQFLQIFFVNTPDYNDFYNSFNSALNEFTRIYLS